MCTPAFWGQGLAKLGISGKVPLEILGQVALSKRHFLTWPEIMKKEKSYKPQAPSLDSQCKII